MGTGTYGYRGVLSQTREARLRGDIPAMGGRGSKERQQALSRYRTQRKYYESLGYEFDASGNPVAYKGTKLIFDNQGKIVGYYDEAGQPVSSATLPEPPSAPAQQVSQPLFQPQEKFSKSVTAQQLGITPYVSPKSPSGFLGKVETRTAQIVKGRERAVDVYRRKIQEPERPIYSKAYYGAGLALSGTFAAGADIVGFGARFIRKPVETTKGMALGLYSFVKEPKPYIIKEIGEFKARPIYKTFKLGTELYIFKKVGDVGYAGVRKGVGYVRTRGRTLVPPETLVEPKVLAGQKSFPTAPTYKHLAEFKSPKYKLPEETAPAAFHATPGTFPKQAVAQAGTSELPGLYVAPSVSTHFLKLGKAPKPFSLSTSFKDISLLPRVPRPTILRIGVAEFKPIPKGTNYSEFLLYEAEKGKAYVPRIKTEKEAIIPPETELIKVRRRYYTEVEGVRVPIEEYEALGGRRIGVAEFKPRTARELSSYYQYKKAVITPSRLSYVSYKSPSYVAPSYKFSYVPPSYKPSYIKITTYKAPSYVRPPEYPKYPGITPPKYPPIAPPRYPPLLAPPKYPPIAPPRYPPLLAPPIYPPEIARSREEDILRKEYQAYVKRKGKFFKIGRPTTKGRALEIGAKEVKRTLAATFKIKPTGRLTQDKPLEFMPSGKIFRKPKKWKRELMLEDIYIQKSGTSREPTVSGARLSSPFERMALKRARWEKMK